MLLLFIAAVTCLHVCSTLLDAKALTVTPVRTQAYRLEALDSHQCEKSVSFAAERVTLGQLLDVLRDVNYGDPIYSIPGADGPWFVDMVLLRLQNQASTAELRRSLERVAHEFRNLPRGCTARGGRPVARMLSELLRPIRAPAVAVKQHVVEATQRAWA
jgi:hypothetical protein